MLKEKTLSMLGLARRAGKLSMGHDMAMQSLKRKKAKLLILCSDVSPRLVGEFEKAKSTAIPLYQVDVTIDEIHFALGYRAGVITVDDDNFSKQIIKLIRQEEHVNGN